ncbi:MAG: hypothetical protein ACLQBB_12095 [Solirubrobacteraceae bacterium]
MPFWLSIASLSLFQGALVALPVPVAWSPLQRLRAGGWAAVLPVSIVAFVLVARGAERASAQGLTYLALIAVPLLAALALGRLSRGARPRRALLAGALFALAWADRGGLAGNGAATLLSGLSCVALGSLLGAITPPRWLAVGIVAMALADTALVVSDLLQQPNDALNAARPAAGLPRLQSASFGSALMGYGDLFVAAVLGGLLASNGRSQRDAAILTAGLALAFDLLFFFVDELPATVPVAVAMLALELNRRRRSAAAPVAPGPARAAMPAPAHAPARPAPRSPAP